MRGLRPVPCPERLAAAVAPTVTNSPQPGRLQYSRRGDVFVEGLRLADAKASGAVRPAGLDAGHSARSL
jgi:hypothetical protein